MVKCCIINLIIAPDQPANISSDETIVDIINNKEGHTTYYDILVTWSPPKFIPDYYVVNLHYFTSNMANSQLNLTVHGVSHQYLDFITGIFKIVFICSMLSAEIKVTRICFELMLLFIWMKASILITYTRY